MDFLRTLLFPYRHLLWCLEHSVLLYTERTRYRYPSLGPSASSIDVISNTLIGCLYAYWLFLVVLITTLLTRRVSYRRVLYSLDSPFIEKETTLKRVRGLEVQLMSLLPFSIIKSCTETKVFTSRTLGRLKLKRIYTDALQRQ